MKLVCFKISLSQDLQVSSSLQWSPPLQQHRRDLAVYLLFPAHNPCIPRGVSQLVPNWPANPLTAVSVWDLCALEKSSRPLTRPHFVHFISCRLWGLQFWQRGYLTGILELRKFLAFESLYFWIAVWEKRARSNFLRQLSHWTLWLSFISLALLGSSNILRFHLARMSGCAEPQMFAWVRKDVNIKSFILSGKHVVLERIQSLCRFGRCRK